MTVLLLIVRPPVKEAERRGHSPTYDSATAVPRQCHVSAFGIRMYPESVGMVAWCW